MAILDLFRLDGQVALITGGGGGLGSAMARAFAEVGADVAVVGRTSASLGRRVPPRRCARAADALRHDPRPTSPTRTASGASSRRRYMVLGGLTILCNNVGGIAGDDAPKPAMETSDASWCAQIDRNLTSVWRLIRAAVPRMARGGVILNMSSIKAFQPNDGSAAWSPRLRSTR